MNRNELVRNIKKHGVKFPSRHRFVLAYKDGKFSIITTENKNKIKLENEKFSHNRSLMLDGSATALLEIKDINSPEEYVDILMNLHKRWGLLEEVN